MRVLIADDHPFVRKGIRETLIEAMDVVEIVEASDGMEAFRILSPGGFDLAIIDVAMPGKDGLDLIKETLALHPGLRFLVMSVYSEREFAERAYRCGSKGYLSKISPAGEFLEAVRRIQGGNTYVSPEYADVLVQGLGRRMEEAARLSDRESASWTATRRNSRNRSISIAKASAATRKRPCLARWKRTGRII
jgi:DNA-binding NarL/FixJ family response regulator